MIDFNDTQAINHLFIGDSIISWYSTGTFSIKDIKTGRYTIHYHTGDVVYFEADASEQSSSRKSDGLATDSYRVVDVWPHDKSLL